MEDVFNTGAVPANETTSQRQQRVLKHLLQTKEEQKRSAHRRDWDRAERQRAQYLEAKYGNLSNAFKVMDFLERPTKTKLKKFRAQAAAANAAAEEQMKIIEEELEAARLGEIQNLNVVETIADSWNSRDKSPLPVQRSSGPSSVLDSGCTADGIIMPGVAHNLKL